MKQEYICCICNRKLIGFGFGNNPDGAMWRDEKGNVIEPSFKENDRCCGECNNLYVIPGRMYKLAKSRKEADEK